MKIVRLNISLSINQNFFLCRHFLREEVVHKCVTCGIVSIQEDKWRPSQDSNNNSTPSFIYRTYHHADPKKRPYSQVPEEVPIRTCFSCGVPEFDRKMTYNKNLGARTQCSG